MSTILQKFAHGWAVEEFLKSQLKNRHAYAWKHGFLSDIANLNIQASDDDRESGNAGGGDEDEEDESGSQEEEKEEDIDMAPASEPEGSDVSKI